MRPDVIRKAKSLIGKDFETRSCSKCFVVDYKGNTDVTVMFYEPVAVVKCMLQHLKRGAVKNPMLPSVYGKGYYGVGKYTANDVKVYKMWIRILERCYDETFKEKQPAYNGVTVCKEWLDFQVFAEWCVNQTHFYSKDLTGKSYHLDKDILVKGSKIYSPETCCFVPHDVNVLFTSNKVNRSELGIGVHKTVSRSRYKSSIHNKYLGRFDTPEEAFQAYKEVKESHVKEVAEKWKNKIDDKTYQALMKWEVNTDD